MLDRLEFDEKTRKAFDEQIIELRKMIEDYLKITDNIRNMPVTKEKDPEAEKRVSDMEIPRKSRDATVIAKELVDDVFNNSMILQHPRFFSFVASSVSPYSIAGAILSDIYNINAGAYSLGPGAAIIEEKMVRWMGGLAGYDTEKCGGIFVSGGSIATMSAFIAARENRLEHKDILKGTIYFSDQTHSSTIKGLRMLGFGPEQIRKIESDEDYKIRIDLLTEAIESDLKKGMKPFLLIGNLGTTNTGTIDPLDKLADVKDKYNLWLHIDGAYGGSSLISPIYRNLSKGIERSDSLAWDSHKWMMQTYSCSTLIAKDRNTLLNAFSEHPEYLADIISSEHADGWDMGPEMSRPTRSIKLWYTVQALGTDLLEEIVEYSFHNAKIVQEMLNERAGWEIISRPSCGTINFRYHPEGYSEEELDKLTGKISETVNESGYAYIVTTTLKGKKVLRMCMINSNTTEEDVRSTVVMLDDIAKKLTSK